MEKPTKIKKAKKKRKNLRDISFGRLIYMQFQKHKAARIALVVLVLLYLSAIFAPMVSPYDPHRRLNIPYMPPQTINFIDEEGKFSFRPFVYGFSKERDEKTYRQVYAIDREKKYPLQAFTIDSLRVQPIQGL